MSKIPTDSAQPEPHMDNQEVIDSIAKFKENFDKFASGSFDMSTQFPTVPDKEIPAEWRDNLRKTLFQLQGASIFFSALAAKCYYHFSFYLPTAGAYVSRGKFHIVMNPWFMFEFLKNPAWRVFVIMHELIHIFNDHSDRAKENTYDHKMWNMAGDFYINLKLAKMAEELNGMDQTKHSMSIIPQNVLQICLDEKYDGWMEDEIYRDLMSKKGGEKQDPEPVFVQAALGHEWRMVDGSVKTTEELEEDDQLAVINYEGQELSQVVKAVTKNGDRAPTYGYFAPDGAAVSIYNKAITSNIAECDPANQRLPCDKGVIGASTVFQSNGMSQDEVPIEDLVGQTVLLFNGHATAAAEIVKTNDDQEVAEVELTTYGTGGGSGDGDGDGEGQKSLEGFSNSPDSNDGQDGNNKHAIASAARAAKIAADESGMQPGNAEADLIRGCLDATESKVDWKDVLRDFIVSTSKEMITYNKYSRRSTEEIIMPSYTGDHLSVYFGIDTSGSMGVDDLTEAMTELKGVLSNFESHRIYVGSCDTRAYKAGVVDTEEGTDFTPDSIELIGGGGTRMSTMVEDAQYLNDAGEEDFDVMIIFTDGHLMDGDIENEYMGEIPLLVMITRSGNGGLEVPSANNVLQVD